MSYLSEQNIIGSLLLDLDALHQIYDILKPEMFQNGLLGRMYVAFLRAYDTGQKMDVVLLTDYLQSESYPQNIVQEEVKSCVTNTLTSASVKQYAQAVARDYKAREFGKLLNAIKISPNEIESQIGEVIIALEAMRDGEKTGAKNLKDIVLENSNYYFNENETQKLYTGFQMLDELLGGLEGGDVIVIGARPAVGKSAFVTQIASNMARKGKKVGFYNLEMKEKQVYERFIVNRSGIGLTRLRRAKKFLGDEEERFRKANEFLCSQDIVISTGSKTVSQIRNESRHMDFDVIIIDYIQLLKSDVRYQNRTSEVGAISKAVKSLAMELNVPIIALSQLNRVSELRENKEPTMAELREAGDIEQDASIIALLWNISDDRQRKCIKIDKNRQGESGKVVLKFDGNQMHFEESEESLTQAAEWNRVVEKSPFD